ncbi:MAG: 50S ribosomal protein L25 [Chloroflexi bacterium]|nr:50S ribosomal protein L25 [Chloroflexota bacterium]
MESVVIKATRRDITGKQVKALRRQGLLPAVLYGHQFDPRPITLDMREASRSLAGLTSSSLVKIDLDGEIFTALVRDKQRDYLKASFLHIDFQVVSMTEKIRAYVQVHVVGKSPAVRDFNAVAEQLISEIEVESLPGNLPESFSVDISSLATIGSHITVKDLIVPEGVEILLDNEEVIVSITASSTEEEVVEEAVEGDTEEPEVIEKGKKEEETEE